MEQTLPGFDRLTIDPDKLGGQPCIRGHRFTVEHLLELLAAGWTPQEIRAEFPFIEPEDIRQVLMLDAPVWWLQGTFGHADETLWRRIPSTHTLGLLTECFDQPNEFGGRRQ